MSDDEKIQELARLREKALHDEASALSTARKEGREEGRAEGREEGRAEAVLAHARLMKGKGYPIADIAEITGLTSEQVAQL